MVLTVLRRVWRKMSRMERPRLSLMELLLVAAAMPIWLFLFVTVPQSTGWGGSAFRFVAAPLVLSGITVAIHRLVRNARAAWALSMFIAGIIAMGSLLVAGLADS
jgi:heme O synthase-like polyprenyltransferase